jgi:DNA-binding NarL/FixJ family response regulator
VTAISNEVSSAIDDLRKIIKGSSFEKPKEKASDHEKKVEKLSKQQLEILKRRMEEKSSFKFIAQELKLSEKQVHLEFLQAYSYLQNQKTSVIPL